MRRIPRGTRKMMATLASIVLVPGTETALPGPSSTSCDRAPGARAIAAESPRVKALITQLEAGGHDALARFWADVTREGTPLIEPVADDSTCLRVTFLHRDPAATSVAVVGGLSAWLDSLSRMERVRDTDLWHRTLALHAATRTGYQFRIVADSAATPRLVHDVLNPHVDSAFGRRSVLIGPTAPGQRWVDPRVEVAKGTVTTITLHMTGRDTAQTAWVYTPPGYDTLPGRLPLLVLFDGGAYFSQTFVGTPRILDNLIADRLIVPVIALFLPQELGPSARQAAMGNNPAYVRFVAEEAIPWVQRQYRAERDPRRVVIGGSSLGGLAASHVALRHSHVVGNVLSQSGAYQWHSMEDSTAEWLTRQYASSPALPIRFYMDAGIFELGVSPFHGVSLLESNRRFRDVLRGKGYALTYREVPGGHEYASWRGTFAEALPLFFGP
jgi:enterochelin esterase family protein